MSEKIEISVIIVNRNAREYLRCCLASLAACPGRRTVEIIVVDNASSDGSVEMTREVFPAARLILNKYNAGFAAANNQGIALASGKYLLLLNNDTVLKNDAAGVLADFMDARPSLALVAPRLIKKDGSTQHSVYPAPGPLLSLLRFLRAYYFLPKGFNARFFSGSFHDYDSAGPVNRVSGACVMLRREAVEKIGALDEDFFFYGEVHDWCWRALSTGLELWYCPAALVTHYGGKSSALQWERARGRRRMLEATFRLYSKHFSARKWSILFLDFLAVFSSWLLRLPTVFFRRAGLEGVEAAWYVSKAVSVLAAFARSRLLGRYYCGPVYERIFEARLAAFLGKTPEETRAAAAEAEECAAEIRRHLAGAGKIFRGGGVLELSCGKVIYILTRLLKPAQVLETGVANGASSYFILRAMERNGRGALTSIDIGEEKGEGFVPGSREIGWLVPENLRWRWTLEIGSSRELLLPALERIGKIDLFLHDSAHTCANMRFEYGAAWPFLSGGGCLVSDDIGFNEAFGEFTEDAGARTLKRGDRLGLALKPGKGAATA
ncbi:MAG: glycosyl transferase family protein [Elusimicrobia bacterium]|nr:MAG: glycosyl transferase family protein [Elusimicrobiota bacterium]KAF0157006.1 MAG: glycosyl transferase family protein [Elusimicrobiota bacterium]